MNDDAQHILRRDAKESTFSRILSRFEKFCAGFEAAIFYDSEGETIDYHSYLDPFETRLMAAHQVVIMSSANYRLAWLNLGNVWRIDVVGTQKEIITYALSHGYFLTLVVKAGMATDALQAHIDEVIQSLTEEAGL